MEKLQSCEKQLEATKGSDLIESDVALWNDIEERLNDSTEVIQQFVQADVAMSAKLSG